MRLNGNINTQSIINNRNANLNQLHKTFQKLSSGKQINQAADNISDFGKSSHLDTRIRMLKRMEMNLQDELSYVQVKEAALSEMTDVAQRMRELKVSSENETNNAEDLEAINHEFHALQDIVSDIYTNTEFNTHKAFTNNYNGLKGDLKVSIEGTIQKDKSIQNFSLDDFDQFIRDISSERGRLAAEANGIEATARVYNHEALNVTNEKSIIVDADMAKESINLARAKVMDQVSLTILAQARLSQESVLNLLK